MDLRLSTSIVCLFALLGGAKAQDWTILSDSAKYNVELSGATCSGDAAPSWFVNNRYGLSSTKLNSGYLRASLIRPTESVDNGSDWKIGYGLDIAVAANHSSTMILQQAFADAQYKKIRLGLGIKERKSEFKDKELSSGSLCLGTNARPVPQMRIEIPEYLNIPGTKEMVAIKGHVAYGMFNDNEWQKDNVAKDENGIPYGRYTKNVLYHSKAGYLRIGNESAPLTFEGGLEMACQFGGTAYNVVGRSEDNTSTNYKTIKYGEKLKDYWNAFIPGGSDQTDGTYANAAGNQLGAWLLSLKYNGNGWGVKAYYDHYFEDHSQMFVQYGWKDGLYGFQATLPENRFVSNIVYEFLNMTHQSGPIYHDHTANIPDQISGQDNYYNHGNYIGWQHNGMCMGNGLITSPAYKTNDNLYFMSNRIKAHHIGINGNPFGWLHYRVLFSHTMNLGTYSLPYDNPTYNNAVLAELNIKSESLEGWSGTISFASDHGKELGNNTGVMLTIRKSGLIKK
ncbi:Capsule assembly protein Wzi [Bacteroidales bacterium KHT7]|nr:Capsule assembly protein Wzi [Bacteroidales bacterium KHT7]